MSPALAGGFFTGEALPVFYLFIWLPWVFIALHQFPLDAASGSYSPAVVPGFSLRSTGPRARAQWLWRTGLAPLRHVESPRTRDRTCVPCIGRQILNHWTTREVQLPVFYYTHFNNEKIEPHSTNLCMIAPIKWQKWNVMSCVSGYNNKLPETG